MTVREAPPAGLRRLQKFLRRPLVSVGLLSFEHPLNRTLQA